MTFFFCTRVVFTRVIYCGCLSMGKRGPHAFCFFIVLLPFMLDFPYFMVQWTCSLVCLFTLDARGGLSLVPHWLPTGCSLIVEAFPFIHPPLHTASQNNLLSSMVTTFVYGTNSEIWD